MFLLVGYSCLAADDPFIGMWIEKVELYRSYPENTRTLATDGKTLIMRSVLSDPEEYILDGIAHPIKDGATDISEIPAPGVFSRRIFREGKPHSESRWEVSADGKTMLVTTTYHSLAGDQAQLDTYDRISGTSGLNGSWRPRKDTKRRPETVVIGLSEEGLVVTRGWGRSWIVDGKSRSRDDPAGASLDAKTTVSKVASSLIERRTVTNGKSTFLTRMEIGSDGKTLTQTDEWTSGNGTPIRSVSVYAKQ